MRRLGMDDYMEAQADMVRDSITTEDMDRMFEDYVRETDIDTLAGLMSEDRP
jgi:hypothetical protein